MLKKFAADIGIVMNQSKEEHLVSFVGPGSVTSMRVLHREGNGQTAWRHFAQHRESLVHC